MGNTQLDHHQVHEITLNLFEISKEVRYDADGTKIGNLVAKVLKNSCKAESCWEKSNQNISSAEEIDSVRKKVLRFLRIRDRWTALGSMLLKSLAYHMVKNTPDCNRMVVILPRTEHQKPYIPARHSNEASGEENLHPLSISHQFPFVGSALLENKKKDAPYLAGLDIVTFDDYNQKLYANEDEFLDVFGGSFAKQEWRAIHAANKEERLEEFYVRWATKEAYTKALGVGLGFEFDSFEIEFQSLMNGEEEVANTGLWSHICSKEDGAFLSGIVKGGMKAQQNLPEVWEFYFLPLFAAKAGENSEVSGCACVCVGPFYAPASESRMTVNVSWTSFGSLVDWHRYDN